MKTFVRRKSSAMTAKWEKFCAFWEIDPRETFYLTNLDFGQSSWQVKPVKLCKALEDNAPYNTLTVGASDFEEVGGPAVKKTLEDFG